MKKLTNQQVQDIISKRDDTIEMISDYKNSNYKNTLFSCKICNNRWTTSPAAVMYKTGCNVCANNKKRLSKKQVQQQISNKDSNIEMIGEYISDRIKTLFQCSICNYEWEATPNNIKFKSGCPACACGGLIVSKKDFINRLNKENNNITLVGSYINQNTKVLVKHECGFEWLIKPATLSRIKSCPKCSGLKKLSHDEFIEYLQTHVPDIETTSTYINSTTKMNFVHSCGGTWSTTANHIKQGTGCPICNKFGGKNANKLISAIEKNVPHIYFQRECSPEFIGRMSYDVALILPNGIPVAVEYDGEYHFMPHWSCKSKKEQSKNIARRRKLDKNKNIMSLKNGIVLFRMSYKEYRDELDAEKDLILELLELSDVYNNADFCKFMKVSQYAN